jgi:hypothetical protein
MRNAVGDWDSEKRIMKKGEYARKVKKENLYRLFSCSYSIAITQTYYSIIQ